MTMLPHQSAPADEARDGPPPEDGVDVLDIGEGILPLLEGENFPEEPQLSSINGVSEDMGTIALDGMPLAAQRVSDSAQALAGDWSQCSDAEIMQRAGLGDDACLEFLIAKYRRPILHFLYRMVRNQAVAEELAQEVFLRVYRARQSYRAEARFSTWLYRIASNLAVNYARDTKM